MIIALSLLLLVLLGVIVVTQFEWEANQFYGPSTAEFAGV